MSDDDLQAMFAGLLQVRRATVLAAAADQLRAALWFQVGTFLGGLSVGLLTGPFLDPLQRIIAAAGLVGGNLFCLMGANWHCARSWKLSAWERRRSGAPRSAASSRRGSAYQRAGWRCSKVTLGAG
jgi:hypothetical protein